MHRIKPYLSKEIGLLLLSIGLAASLFAQKETVTITGFAPQYVGKELSFNQIEDYYSQIESSFAKTTVKADSTFSVKFYLDKTQKIVVRGMNNFGWMYVEPNATYDIFVPDRNPIDPQVKTGNQIEISFFDLKPKDINYKILSFQRWTDEYMARYFPLKFSDPSEFVHKMDTFKYFVERAYKEDSSIYFLTFVKFSMAEFEDIQFSAARGRDEKYDFFIKPSPVFYENDAYMSYIKKHYKNLIPQLSNEVNNEVYLAVLKSSPKLVMKALGKDYGLQNLRLREMVMIQSLSEVFYSDDFPQTNITTIFDSLKRRCLFPENQIIAKNVYNRLTELVPGGKSPDFVLFKDGKAKTHQEFKGKHLYITFYDPKSPNNQKEMVLLKEMHKKYINDVQFLTIIIDNGDLTPKEKEELKSIQWDNYSLPSTDDFLKKFRVTNFPTYVLIDPQGYIVGAPALGPSPNGQYETIDKTFYYIQKYRREELEKGN
jgi:hypothetical protein